MNWPVINKVSGEVYLTVGGGYIVSLSSKWLLWLLANLNNIYVSYKLTHLYYSSLINTMVDMEVKLGEFPITQQFCDTDRIGVIALKCVTYPGLSSCLLCPLSALCCI